MGQDQCKRIGNAGRYLGSIFLYRLWRPWSFGVTSDTVGLAIGPVSETANDVNEAVSKARQMYEEGLANVAITDQAGHKIDGDELLACITGKKTITSDLQAK
ncbi:MAG: hypothetical protein WB689_29245 [Xanthobacteraceae bacterium]